MKSLLTTFILFTLVSCYHFNDYAYKKLIDEDKNLLHINKVNLDFNSVYLECCNIDDPESEQQLIFLRFFKNGRLYRSNAKLIKNINKEWLSSFDAKKEIKEWYMGMGAYYLVKDANEISFEMYSNNSQIGYWIVNARISGDTIICYKRKNRDAIFASEERINKRYLRQDLQLPDTLPDW
jgi:hypothetical protein